MKFNKWTLGLAAVGVVSLTSAARADESKISQVQTALSNTTISGYADVAAQFNPNSSSGGVPNYYYGATPNSINLNAVDIAMDKPMDESPWASGYHVEFLVGPQGTAMGLYDNVLRQAYVSLRAPVGNGIDFKLGVFDTILGYESTTTGNNPNYSHSYGYNMEPTTHTGILASYKGTDWLTGTVGIVDNSYVGAGVYAPNNGAGLYRPTFLFGPTFTAPDSFGWAKGATLSIANLITGGNQQGNDTGNGSGVQHFFAGLTLPTPVAALKTGASFDYLAAHDISANEWAVAGYATYQFSDKLSLNERVEYFAGEPLNTTGAYDTTANNVPPASYGHAYEITSTLQYALWANVLTRLEFRWDHSPEGYTANNGTFTQKDAFLLAAQAVYTF